MDIAEIFLLQTFTSSNYLPGLQNPTGITARDILYPSASSMSEPLHILGMSLVSDSMSIMLSIT